MSAISGLSAYQWQQDMFSYSSGSNYSTTNTSDVTGYGSVTDSLDISAAGMEKYSSMWILDELYGASQETINGKYKTLGTIADELTEELSGFTELAGSIFSIGANSDPITLQATGKGSLVEVNENGSTSNISGNSTMTARFMLCAARAAILHASENNPAFTGDYNQDPAACMEKYEDTLKEYMLSYQITLSGSGTTTSFESPLEGEPEE